jgi:hypothetical protein
MERLRCTNEECEAHDDNHLFDIVMTVDDEGDQCEHSKIPGKYYTCCHCESVAEWKEV